ncbi:MAG: putative quinol monooxygenase [Solirubrobacteraceae bacterium]
MIIVAGHLTVDPDERDSLLAGCADVVEQGRAAEGCLDFALSPDLVDPTRLNVFERWTTVDCLTRFRGSGPSAHQRSGIRRTFRSMRPPRCHSATSGARRVGEPTH